MFPTLILRHRKENKKKCSLTVLETRKDFCFLSYPQDPLPDLSHYVLLTLDAPILTEADKHKGLFLVDATWNYAKKMLLQIPKNPLLEYRSLPSHFRTAYPRKQTGCAHPEEGLSSLEALFLAYLLTGRQTEHLLDHYYWKDLFLEKNLPYLKLYTSQETF